VLDAPADVDLDQAQQVRRDVVPRHGVRDGLERLVHLVPAAAVDDVVDRVLRLDVDVERGRPHAHPACHLAQREPRHALLGHDVHGDERFQSQDGVVPADESDYETEYLSLDIAAAVVPDLAAAIRHIRRYSSGHSDAIVTRSQPAARRFVAEVDSAAVLVNASTRFTDGGEFGFGAEIGISTQKLHARGPMGLPEMTSTKYVVTGDGHVR
jgi:hypothetical protein